MRFKVLLASVISDAIGVGAKKKIAKWRINMLEGNVANSYSSRVMNSESQMERINEILLLVRFMEKMTGQRRKQG